MIFCCLVACCNGHTSKKNLYFLFENKKNGMCKFFDYTYKDSVFFISLSDGIYLNGIKFTPKAKSDTVLYSDFFVNKNQLHDFLWVRKNFKPGLELFHKSNNTFIVEKISNDSVRITPCSNGSLEE